MIELYAVVNGDEIEDFTVHQTRLGSMAAWVGRGDPKYKVNAFTEHWFCERTRGSTIRVEKIIAYTAEEDARRGQKKKKEGVT